MDAAQFERLLAEHQRMVFSIALHSLRNHAIAEEITQDVFLAFYQHHGEIESPEHLVNWLRRVTTRRCIDQVRRQRLRQWLALDDTAELVSSAARPDRMDPLISERLQRLIAGLPAVPRLALVLRYQEDLDLAEIGRVLDLPEKTVKKHLRRALLHLKLRLKPPQRANERGAGTEAEDIKKPDRGVLSCGAVNGPMANLE